MGAHSSTQIPSEVIDFPSAAEFSNLWGGRDAPPRPPAIYVPAEDYFLENMVVNMIVFQAKDEVPR